MVAAGYAGDMPEELANALLDDIDYHFNKVKCRKIEQMMPQLMKMVEGWAVYQIYYKWYTLGYYMGNF